MAAREVAILGVGMHPWGKWGRNFVEYGVAAAQAALADAGIPWSDVQFVAGGETIRNGYPGYVAGASIAQALGWNGAQVTSSYGACASGSQAIAMARAQILAGLCDVALVVGADTTPKGFFAPAGSGDRTRDPDWLRFRLLGATNPVYFGLYARRRMDLYGDTERDFAQVKVKNSRCGAANPPTDHFARSDQGDRHNESARHPSQRTEALKPPLSVPEVDQSADRNRQDDAPDRRQHLAADETLEPLALRHPRNARRSGRHRRRRGKSRRRFRARRPRVAFRRLQH